MDSILQSFDDGGDAVWDRMTIARKRLIFNTYKNHPYRDLNLLSAEEIKERGLSDYKPDPALLKDYKMQNNLY